MHSPSLPRRGPGGGWIGGNVILSDAPEYSQQHQRHNGGRCESHLRPETRLNEGVIGGDGPHIGGTRLAALNLLLKRKKIAADYLVPCDVRPAADPSLTEASLAENFVREVMHPADEFDAFKKLADEGQGPETIAARFFLRFHRWRPRSANLRGVEGVSAKRGIA